MVGFLIEAPPLRIAGLSSFAIVLGRVVVIDLDCVDAIWRVLAFMGIAAALLASSWMYVRNAAKKVDA